VSGPEQLVVIGSGPAAWTAAIYAARASLRPLVLEGEPTREMLPGGQLMTTTEVENFPGFPEGVSGPDLVERMRAQALRFGTRVLAEQVTAADLATGPFRLALGEGPPVLTRSVIVATGARANWLDVPGEARLARSGGGVSACAVCDGALPFFRDGVLAVVGGGDTAMEEALYLTKYAAQVVLIHRRGSLRASRVMAERVLSHDGIRVEWHTRVLEVLGNSTVSGLRLEDTLTGRRRTLPVDGLFVAIGHTPNTAFLAGQLARDPAGYISVRPGRTETGVPGVFAAGDVMDSYYRQAITAAGTGAMAAIEAERWLAHDAHDLRDARDAHDAHDARDAGDAAVAAHAGGAVAGHAEPGAAVAHAGA
jgi:thioredoxin reductase (NADPH)